MYFDILILSRLRRGPAHGYEIKKHVSRVNGGTLSVNNNVLYPALRRFEESGAIERIPEATPPETGRPPRTVYRLTPAGEHQLRQLLEVADPGVVADPAEFATRVSMFEDIPPVVRRQLLARRREIVEGQRLHMLEMRQLPEVGESGWAQRVIAFRLAQREAELAWLDQLEGAAELDEPEAGLGDSADPLAAPRSARAVGSR